MDDMKPETISCSDVHAEFTRLVTIANRIAREFNGSRDTCILTSFALNDALQRLGYSSRPLRIGFEAGRDHNAALNLARIAASSAVTACREERSGVGRKARVKRSSMKQEEKTAVSEAA